MDLNYAETISKEIRKLTITEIAHLGVGHIGGCLSIIDLLTVLYFFVMNIDNHNPKKLGRDRLFVSKGHSGPAVYATLALKGYFPTSELFTLNQFSTKLPSHCDMNKTPGIDMTTGSLGQGFSCAVGAAIGSKLKNDNAYIFTVIGDGESQEGQIWEAAMYAAQKKLDNLIGFTDYNRLQIDGTISEINDLINLKNKWISFGWNVFDIDGHNLSQIYETIIEAKKIINKPTMIILNTIKGKGISFIEQVGVSNHNMKINMDDLTIALKELS